MTEFGDWTIFQWVVVAGMLVIIFFLYYLFRILGQIMFHIEHVNDRTLANTNKYLIEIDRSLTDIYKQL